MHFYQKHAFFCTHSKQNGKKCCENANANYFREYAKVKIKELGLSESGKIRINQAGCLGRCSEGPTLVIYPEQVWYTYETEEDIDEIINEHLIHGRVVDRLLMDIPEK